MGVSSRWRCGLARGHEGDHGEWVRAEQARVEKWRCGIVAQAPRALRDGVLFWCPWEGCEYRSPKSGPARGHWYSHIPGGFTALHGTDAGYYNHRRLGEAACEPCLLAHRKRSREWSRQWRRGFGRFPRY